MGEVGDFDCHPLTPSEELSFRNKNHCIYMLLQSNVLIERGINILYQHLANADRRRSLFDLNKRFFYSDAAVLIAQKLLLDLMTRRYQSSTTEPASEFMARYDTDRGKCNEMTRGTEDSVSSLQRKGHLKQAVYPVRALRGVKDNEEQVILGGAKPCDLDQHVHLLT